MKVPEKWRKNGKFLKRYGNLRGANYLKRILEFRKSIGDDRPIIMPSNIRVVSARNGQLLMNLSEGRIMILKKEQ